MNKIENANNYIEENKGKAKSKPLYHFAPPIGWMNDPNGFSYYNGEYHLFYQYGPYSLFWDNIHWGHAVSDDLVNWKHRPVVMAPDIIPDISGCFSGSAIEKDGKLYLMYTGHIDPNLGFDLVHKEIVQQQCLAMYHADGTVEKYQNNPVIDQSQLPNGYKIRDFRDPKVYKKGEYYYCVLAGRNENSRGSILLYRSLDLITWDFVADIYRRPVSDNTLFECPDLLKIDGKDVLIFSIMPCSPDYSENIKRQVEYVIGNMNYETNIFEEETRGIIDYGNNYYAPQTTVDKEGNQVIIGWICDWSKINEEFVTEYGYNGIMTLPRKLGVDSGRLIQTPTADIQKYESQVRVVTDFELMGELLLGDSPLNLHLHVEIEKLNSVFTIDLLKNESKGFSFTFDPYSNLIKLFSSYKVAVDNSVVCELSGSVEIDVFVDKHCLELYVNGYAFTFLCYDFDKGHGTSIHTSEKQLIKCFKHTEIIGVKIE